MNNNARKAAENNIKVATSTGEPTSHQKHLIDAQINVESCLRILEPFASNSLPDLASSLRNLAAAFGDGHADSATLKSLASYFVLLGGEIKVLEETARLSLIPYLKTRVNGGGDVGTPKSKDVSKDLKTFTSAQIKFFSSASGAAAAIVVGQNKHEPVIVGPPRPTSPPKQKEIEIDASEEPPSPAPQPPSRRNTSRVIETATKTSDEVLEDNSTNATSTATIRRAPRANNDVLSMLADVMINASVNATANVADSALDGRPSVQRQLKSKKKVEELDTCTTCGCDTFVKNAFKPNQCTQCFHAHHDQ